jgi:signal transduction histidine kinase
MSATPHASPGAAHTPNILADLMHSLCQPLTTLRCSLELSLDQEAQFPAKQPTKAFMERQREGISVALQQTDEVIRLIQLMRDYLDADQRVAQTRSSESSPCRTA